MINISNVQKPLPPLSRFLPRNKLKNTSTSWYATLLQIDFEYIGQNTFLILRPVPVKIGAFLEKYWEI